MEIICHDGNKITHAEKKLLAFHCIDVVKTYDYIDPPSPDELTWEDVKLANIMGARSSRRWWQSIMGRSLVSIPRDRDLTTMTDAEWESCQQGLKQALQELLGNPGIGCAVLTKALHRKRPALLPVCDSIIVEAILPGSNPKEADTILGIMRIFRKVGRANSTNLQQIRGFLVEHNQPRVLTNVRMLEALYWMEKTTRYKKLWEFMELLQWCR